MTCPVNLAIPNYAINPTGQQLRFACRWPAVGGGVCVNKAGTEVEVSAHVVGFITVQAESLDQAREFPNGNPVFEAGGTVEIRELPRT